jgi:hypothetical protein
MTQDSPKVSPVTATLASALIPGAGYFLIGERKRGLITGLAVILLFAAGVLIAGARVISVPGFDEDGYMKYLERYGSGYVFTTTPAVGVRSESGDPKHGPWTVVRRMHDGSLKEFPGVGVPPRGPAQWVLSMNPTSAVTDNLSFVGQAFNGPLCVAGGYFSLQAARATPQIPKSYSRFADIGSLYTAVSGMLNLMVIVDTYCRARRKELGQ